MSNVWNSNMGFGRNVAVPAAPGGVTGAQNGTSLSGSDVELGGNPLLHFTDVELDNNLFSFSNLGVPYFGAFIGVVWLGDFTGGANNTQLEVNDNNSTVDVSAGGGRYMGIDMTNFLYSFGNTTGLSNQSNLSIDDNGKLFEFRSDMTLETYMKLDGGNDVYFFGDINNVNNGIQIAVEDAFNSIILGEYAALGNGTQLFIGTFSSNLQFYDNNNGYLDIRPNRFIMGDQGGVGNGVKLEMNDTSQITTLGDSGGISNGTFFRIDGNQQRFEWISNGAEALLAYMGGVNPIYRFGDCNFNNNNTNITISDSIASSIELLAGPNANPYIKVDGQNARVDMGDTQNFINNMVMNIDVNNSEIEIRNGAGTAAIVMNGNTGFTGTVSPVTSITVNGGIVTAVS